MRKHLPLYLTLVLGAALLAALILSYFSGQRIQGALFGADAIQTPALFENVFGHGGSLGDWNLAPAPAVFPEFIMYALAYLLGPTTFWRILIYAVIQVILCSGAVFLLAREVLKRSQAVATVLVMSALVLLGLVGTSNYLQIFQSSFHFGGLLCQLFSIVLILHVSRSGNSTVVSRVMITALSVIAVAATMSDALYVAQFLVVLVVWCGLKLIRREISLRRALLWAGLPALSGVLGLLLYKFLIPNPKSSAARVNLGTVIPNAKELARQLSDTFGASPWTFTFVAAFFLFTFVATIFFAQRRNFLGLSTPLLSLMAFSFLATAFSFVACILAQMGPSPRYVMPFFTFPFIVAVFVLAELGVRVFTVVGLAAAGLLTLGCVLIAVTSVAENGLSDSYYTSTERCIDEAVLRANVKHGIANYWDAKPIQEFSRAGITLLQVKQDLTAFRWSSTNANEQGTFDFALVNNAPGKSPGPSMKDLVQMNGKPTMTVQCDKYSFYSWGAGGLSLPAK